MKDVRHLLVQYEIIWPIGTQSIETSPDPLFPVWLEIIVGTCK